MLRGLQAPQQYVILTHKKLHLYNIYATNQQKHKNLRGKSSIRSLFVDFLLWHMHTQKSQRREAHETQQNNTRHDWFTLCFFCTYPLGPGTCKTTKKKKEKWEKLSTFIEELQKCGFWCCVLAEGLQTHNFPSPPAHGYALYNLDHDVPYAVS